MRLGTFLLGLGLVWAPHAAFAQRSAGAWSAQSAHQRARAQALTAGEAPAPGERAPSSVLYALLPFRNLSADAAAAREVQDRLCAALGARGAAFVPEAELDHVLRARRVRYTDSLAVEDARALRAATGASFALAGVLLDFAGSPEPRLGLGVRVLDLSSGERVQSALVTLQGEQFRGLLGLGAIEDVDELVERGLAQVLGAFDERGVPKPRGAPSASDAAHTRFARLERVAVLSFVNRSGLTAAGSGFAEILAHEWFQRSGVQVVEASELRSALVRARIRTLQEVDARTMEAVGGAVGVQYFVLGSVERFGDEVVVRDQRFLEVEVSLRLVDARSGMVVDSHNLRLRGDDGETLLRLGIERDPLALAAEAARELLLALEGGS